MSQAKTLKQVLCLIVVLIFTSVFALSTSADIVISPDPLTTDNSVHQVTCADTDNPDNEDNYPHAYEWFRNEVMRPIYVDINEVFGSRLADSGLANNNLAEDDVYYCYAYDLFDYLDWMEFGGPEPELIGFDSAEVLAHEEPENQAPVIENCPDAAIDEDTRNNNIRIDLHACSHDDDNRDEELSYTLEQDNAGLINCRIDQNRYVVCNDPSANGFGANDITITVTDPDELSESDDVTITVNSVNDNPVCNIVDFETQEDTRINDFNLNNIDNGCSDIDGDELIYTVISEDTNEADCEIEGSLMDIIPARNWNGETQCRIRVSDNNGGISQPWFGISIIAVNDAPVMENCPDAAIDEDTANNQISIDLWAYTNDIDNPDAELSYEITRQANSELINCHIDDNRYVRCNDPAKNANGVNDITLTVTDPNGLRDTDNITISINPVNDASVIENCPDAAIDEDTRNNNIRIDLHECSHDDDNEYDELTYNLTQENARLINCRIDQNRYVVCNDPAENANGNNDITLTITDPDELSDTDEITITVNPINDAPIVSDIPNVSMDEEGSDNSIFLDNYVRDVDNDDNEMTWTVELVRDERANPNDNNPVAVGKKGYNNNWVTRIVGFLGKITHPLSRPADVKYNDYNHNMPERDDEEYDFGNIVITITDERQVIITPIENWHGQMSFRFIATDPDELSDSDEMTVNVEPVNDAPIVSDIPDVVMNVNQFDDSIFLDNYVNDVDNDDNEITWTVELAEERGGSHGGIKSKKLKRDSSDEDYATNERDDEEYDFGNIVITITDERQVIITPIENWHGQMNFRFIATDPDGLSDSDEMTVTVLEVPEHDIALTNPEFPEEAVQAEEEVTFMSAVANLGDFTETTTLRFFVDDEEQADCRQDIIELEPEAITEEYNCAWLAQGEGIHTLRIQVDAIENEENLDDNTIESEIEVTEEAEEQHDIALTNTEFPQEGVEAGEEVTFTSAVANLGDFTETSTLRFFVDNEEQIDCRQDIIELEPEAITEEYNCAWLAQGEGIHTLRIEIDAVENEANLNNNIVERELEVIGELPELTAVIRAEPAEGRAPLEVSLSGTAFNAIGDVRYRWVFGDGTVNQQNYRILQHVFDKEGVYTITLIITDSLGRRATATQDITVGKENNDNMPRSRVRIGSVMITADPYFQPGDYVPISLNFENIGISRIRDVKVVAGIPELGVRRAVGPFNVDVNNDAQRTILLELPPDTPPGEYTVRVVLEMKDLGIHRTKHRPIIVLPVQTTT